MSEEEIRTSVLTMLADASDGSVGEGALIVAHHHIDSREFNKLLGCMENEGLIGWTTRGGGRYEITRKGRLELAPEPT